MNAMFTWKDVVFLGSAPVYHGKSPRILFRQPAFLGPGCAIDLAFMCFSRLIIQIISQVGLIRLVFGLILEEF